LSSQRRRRFELGCSLGDYRSHRNQQQDQNAAPKGAGPRTAPLKVRNSLRIALTNMSYSPINPAVGRRYAKSSKPTTTATARG
jgi:hypothetical protein